MKSYSKGDSFRWSLGFQHFICYSCGLCRFVCLFARFYFCQTWLTENVIYLWLLPKNAIELFFSIEPFFYYLDCEHSLFFFIFSESNALARQRRSRETRETRAAAREEKRAINHARGHLRVSRFARRPEKRETARSLFIILKNYKDSPLLHFFSEQRP